MPEAIMACVERYRPILEANPDAETCDHLLNMLDTMEENRHRWPIDKSNRWLGYVQGYMTSLKLITVDDEREFSRPIFHAYYEAEGIEIPKSVDVTK